MLWHAVATVAMFDGSVAAMYWCLLGTCQTQLQGSRGSLQPRRLFSRLLGQLASLTMLCLACLKLAGEAMSFFFC